MGKTAAAVEIARAIDAEIVSADSGQVYRGMDIGTAKPIPEERRDVRFHLIDIIDPTEQFSAADFRVRALDAIREIQSKGKRVLVVGGTGLYLRALEQGLFEGPSRDPLFRAGLEKRIAIEGLESLHEELKKVDLETARAIPPQNRQRIIRALEVYHLTGRPISAHWQEHKKIPPHPPLQKGGRGDFLKFGLDLPRDELNRRIDERVDRMIDQGFVAEVRSLTARWGATAPGLRIIGYKEMVAHLEGRVSLDETVRLIKIHTHQYAKRQLTWFRKDNEIRWVNDVRDIRQRISS